MSKENNIVQSTVMGHYVSSEEFLKSELSRGKFKELKSSKFFKRHFAAISKKDSRKK